MKKGWLAIWIRKERRLRKLKVKKRNKRGVSEGFGFLVFHFLSKGVSRKNIITGEGDFPFFQRGREDRESEA